MGDVLSYVRRLMERAAQEKADKTAMLAAQEWLRNRQPSIDELHAERDRNRRNWGPPD